MLTLFPSTELSIKELQVFDICSISHLVLHALSLTKGAWSSNRLRTTELQKKGFSCLTVYLANKECGYLGKLRGTL